MERTSSADAFVEERVALHDTLAAIGPRAPTLVDGWSAADLAAHVVATEQLRGVPTFLGRSLVARLAWRLNGPFAPIYALDIRRFGRHGFDWTLRRLAADPPALLCRPSVTPVSLFEVYVHHEDVRRANAMPARAEPDILPALNFLLRYQRRPLRGLGLRAVLPDGSELLIGAGPEAVVRGTPGDVLLWLAGRSDAAHVELAGDDSALRRLASADLRI